jgi:hypothetical protein
VARPFEQTAGMALAFLGIATAAAVLLPRLLGVAAGPEAEIIGAVKDVEGRKLTLTVPGTSVPLISRDHVYDRITVSPGENETLVANATLDFNGTLGETRVSSLGLERVEFALKDGDWEPTHGLAPRLVAAVAALESRRQALQVGKPALLEPLRLPSDAGGLEGASGDHLRQVWELKDRRYEVKAWLLRFERDEVEVREEYRLVGSLPSRPVDEVGARSFRLREKSGGQFLFDGNVL